MAYDGFLLKLSNANFSYNFPRKYMKFDSYSAYVNMQDLEPWTDADGFLHREAVDLKALKVEFDTVPMMTSKQFTEIMNNIEKCYTVKKARQFLITAYIPEYDNYVTQTGYLADFTPPIHMIKKEIVYYDPFHLEFIGGVYDG